jgi:hypothetical protein
MAAMVGPVKEILPVVAVAQAAMAVMAVAEVVLSAVHLQMANRVLPVAALMEAITVPTVQHNLVAVQDCWVFHAVVQQLDKADLVAQMAVLTAQQVVVLLKVVSPVAVAAVNQTTARAHQDVTAVMVLCVSFGQATLVRSPITILAKSTKQLELVQNNYITNQVHIPG